MKPTAMMYVVSMLWPRLTLPVSSASHLQLRHENGGPWVSLRHRCALPGQISYRCRGGSLILGNSSLETHQWVPGVEQQIDLA